MTGRDSRDRGRDRDRDRDRNQRQNPPAPRLSTFFISGNGIDREVITTDICRILGNDALVKPGQHKDSSGRTQDGYYITAYRAPTSAQLQDLRDDSTKWREEKRKNASSGGPAPRGDYNSSRVRAERTEQYQEELSPPTGYAYLPPAGQGNQANQANLPPNYRRHPEMPSYGQPMPPPNAPGGYSYPTQPEYGYGSAAPIATVNYGVDSSRGVPDPNSRMAAAPNYPPGPGAPPSSVFAGRGEAYGSTYPGSTNTQGQPPPNYPPDYYNRPGPAPSFPSGPSAEDQDESNYYEDGDDMDYETSSTPNAPPPASSRSGGGHRDHDFPNKRTHGGGGRR